MKLRLLCALPFAVLATPALAIVGHASTGDIADGGDSRYLATGSQYSGVVGLLMTSESGDSWSCTGSLLSNRRSIVTAAHCVAGGYLIDDVPLSAATTVVYFDRGTDPDTNIFTETVSREGLELVSVSDYHVMPYSGAAHDNNDIAVLTLSELAPDWATAYELYDGADLTGLTYNIVGYGLQSAGGGSVGTADSGSDDIGRRRQGENRYDYAYGDGDLVNSVLPEYEGSGIENDAVYTSDFDDGSTARDASCLLATGLGGAEPSDKFCDLGVGANESVAASGDSGGPQFVNGKIASITSSGSTLSIEGGDLNNALDDTYGERSNLVSLYQHRDFITRAMMSAIPEPATWLQMLLGFGLLGGALRSRRPVRTAAVARI